MEPECSLQLSQAPDTCPCPVNQAWFWWVAMQALTVLMLKLIALCRHAAKLRLVITIRTTDTHKSSRRSSCEETAGIFLSEWTSTAGVQCSSVVGWTAAVSLQWHGWGVLSGYLAADGLQAPSKTLVTIYQNIHYHNPGDHNINLCHCENLRSCWDYRFAFLAYCAEDGDWKWTECQVSSFPSTDLCACMVHCSLFWCQCSTHFWKTWKLGNRSGHMIGLFIAGINTGYRLFYIFFIIKIIMHILENYLP
jgi:hypothetical protein